MTRRLIAAVAALLAIVACGGGTAGPQGPTVQSVSVQQKDLPAGMVKCDLSGDIQSFLAKEKTPDPKTYTDTKNQWENLQKKGATAAYAALYTDSAAHCASIKNAGSDLGSANYKLVLNFVVQFKDEKSAVSCYMNDSVFGFGASSLKTGGAPVIEGTKTGLTPNSIVLNASLPPQSYYIAVWQNKTFMGSLAILNIDAETSKKAAVSVNSRIK